MSMIRATIRTGFAVAALTFCGIAVNAQVKSATPPADQSGPTRTDGPRHGMGRGGERGEFGPMKGFRELNLSDTQRQQMRDLRVKFEQSIAPLGEEMRQIRTKFDQATATIADQQRAQTLRQQMRAAHDQLMTETQGLLTPEQQEQLKTFRQQMQQRREEYRQRHGADQNQDAPPPAQ